MEGEMTPIEGLRKSLDEASAKLERPVKSDRGGSEFRARGAAAWLVPLFAAYGFISFMFDVAGLFVD